MHVFTLMLCLIAGVGVAMMDKCIDFLRHNKDHVTYFVAFARMHPCLYVVLYWFASMLASMAAMTIDMYFRKSYSPL